MTMTPTSFKTEKREWNKFKMIVQYKLHSKISHVLPAMVKKFVEEFEDEDGRKKIYSNYFKK